MQNEFLPYTDLDNRSILSEIGHQIIMDVAPDEELASRKMTAEILQRYELGEVFVAETSGNDPGGFGDFDFVTLVVIPVLVSTLSEICKQLVVPAIRDIIKTIKNSEADRKKVSQIIDVTVEKTIDEYNKKVKSGKSHKSKKNIQKSVKVRIRNYLEIE
jgi:hypothetical protein